MSTEKNHKPLRLHTRVTPNAARNEITGFTDGVLRVKIEATPLKGKANKELVNYLSRELGVNKTSLQLVKGQSSRNKVISINGITEADIIRRFSV